MEKLILKTRPTQSKQLALNWLKTAYELGDNDLMKRALEKLRKGAPKSTEPIGVHRIEPIKIKAQKITSQNRITNKQLKEELLKGEQEVYLRIYKEYRDLGYKKMELTKFFEIARTMIIAPFGIWEFATFSRSRIRKRITKGMRQYQAGDIDQFMNKNQRAFNRRSQ